MAAGRASEGWPGAGQRAGELVGWVAHFVYAVSTVQQCNARKHARGREGREEKVVVVVVVAEVVVVAMAVGDNRRETAGGGGKSIS